METVLLHKSAFLYVTSIFRLSSFVFANALLTGITKTFVPFYSSFPEISDIFRYILQSDKRGLVALKEELMFIEAFRHVMEVRFANKLTFTIDIPEDKWNLRIPVLSLLPLVENATVHNIIDSDHRMDIRIELNERMELVVTNPIYPKLTPPDTNGTGLKNLENRFLLLMDKQIRVESDEQMFKVYLPLK